MRFSILLAAGLPLVSSLAAGVKSGHAAVELLSGVASYQAGKSFPVAIRLRLDPGWHSYWINPGESGVPLTATWTLPEGWTAGELRQPLPKRFMTGELAGLGYEGAPVFLVDLTPPAGATGDAACRVKLSWLTCNDSACVPGKAELSLTVAAGDGAAGEDAALIGEAAKMIPVDGGDLVLTVKEAGSWISLGLESRSQADLAGVAAFPATPEVLDPAAPIVFERVNDGWLAKVKKNEYAEGPPTLLTIVLAGGKLSRPLAVTWRAGK